jgi:uncharacterized protein (TIGR02118 family)
MHKVIVLYKHPVDETAFEKYYSEIHLPLAAKIPDVDHAGFTKFSPGPDGSAPEFYRMAELYFVTEDLMKQSFELPEARPRRLIYQNLLPEVFFFWLEQYKVTSIASLI